MKERIHRYAPEAPFSRLLLALAVLAGALPLTFLGLFPLLVFLAGRLANVVSLALVLLLVPGVRGLQAAYYLARGVADQAEAAPESANPARARRSDDADADDPVRLLQERYARGEIDEATFEARMERLLDSDRRASGGGGRERETALE